MGYDKVLTEEEWEKFEEILERSHERSISKKKKRKPNYTKKFNILSCKRKNERKIAKQ